MKTFLTAAALAFGGLGALAIPAGAQPYDQGYGAYGPQPYDSQAYGPYDQPYDDQPYADQSYDPQAYDDPTYNYYGSDYGYCDPVYGCPDDFYDLPLYYGQVYWDNSWYPGPFYYRDFGGRRQFWMHGGWRDGNYRGGRFGSALGRDFYRSHAYAGRNFGGRGGSYGYVTHY